MPRLYAQSLRWCTWCAVVLTTSRLRLTMILDEKRVVRQFDGWASILERELSCLLSSAMFRFHQQDYKDIARSHRNNGLSPELWRFMKYLQSVSPESAFEPVSLVSPSTAACTGFSAAYLAASSVQVSAAASTGVVTVSELSDLIWPLLLTWR